MYYRLIAVAVIMAIAGFAPGVEAETFNVPGDFDTIQSAIYSASDSDTILVGPGIYMENINFEGKALSLISTHGPKQTVIDGRDSSDEHAGNVVTFCSGEGPESVLDGFTINRGSGYLVEDFGEPFFTAGGGICCNSSSPMISNCIISGNHADRGGGVAMISASPTLVNCTITGNMAGHGGGIVCRGSSPLIINCTISGNAATRGGGILNSFYSSPVVVNSILWGDSPNEIFNQPFYGNYISISYSDVQGGWGGNMNQNPLFVDPIPAGGLPVGGDYHLLPDSPCIDAGATDSGSFDFPADDIDDNFRPQGEGYDIGSDEYVNDCIDQDRDGVCGDSDFCPDTPLFAVEDDVMDEEGCVGCELLEEYINIPPPGGYRNHGGYVKRAKNILDQYLDAELISQGCAGYIINSCARSDTGKSPKGNGIAGIPANTSR